MREADNQLLKAERPKLEIVYDVVDMAQVVEYYVKDYQRPPRDYEWFYDASKRKLILRLFIEKEQNTP